MCIHHGQSYTGCDGNRYFHCNAKDKDMMSDECACADPFNLHPEDLCKDYEEEAT